jgi:formylglycine-generating enzyme required for sulfatase activity
MLMLKCVARLRLIGIGLLTFALGSTASAVTMNWTPVGDVGNACDPQSQGCFGAVEYSYLIGTYEVTNAQYTEFLNAKAASDPLALWNPLMGAAGGIARSGVSGSFTYTTIGGLANNPVNWVSFYDAVRFANWLSNGQGGGSTETGSYTLLGGTATPSNGATLARNPSATIVLPTENEWYKAAYYNGSSTSFFDYPTGSNTAPTCSAPTATPNSANCNNAVGGPVSTGSYTGSPSPYGTYDQGGNVAEWNEALNALLLRGIRGGGYTDTTLTELASIRIFGGGSTDGINLVFRLAEVPEPGTGLLVLFGMLGLARWRRP